LAETRRAGSATSRAVCDTVEASKLVDGEIHRLVVDLVAVRVQQDSDSPAGIDVMSEDLGDGDQLIAGLVS
jgi:hypothetical protein